MMSTLKFLDGSEHRNLKGKITKKAFVHKLLPFDLMDSNILKSYSKLFNSKLKDGEKIASDQTSKAKYNFGWKKFEEILREEKCI